MAATFGWDRLLDNVMAYWLTNTAGSAARLYAESARAGTSADRPVERPCRRADRPRRLPVRAAADPAGVGRPALPHRALGRADPRWPLRRVRAARPRSSTTSASSTACSTARDPSRSGSPAYGGRRQTKGSAELNERIAVMGAGVMGAGIAQVMAIAGHDVVGYDVTADVLTKARRGRRHRTVRGPGRGRARQADARSSRRRARPDHVHRRPRRRRRCRRGHRGRARAPRPQDRGLPRPRPPCAADDDPRLQLERLPDQRDRRRHRTARTASSAGTGHRRRR